jgi:hypothetical protein
MFATRSARSRRPAAFGTGRLLVTAAVGLVMIIGVVFAHGGGCAAMELAEAVAHRTHPQHSVRMTALRPVLPLSGVPQDADCLHRRLPPRHQHGTEQDCSAISPAGASTTFDMPAAMGMSGIREADGCSAASPDAARPSVPDLMNLCVMRL